MHNIFARGALIAGGLLLPLGLPLHARAASNPGVISNPSAASTAVTPGNSPGNMPIYAPRPCQTLWIHLRGTLPAISQCMDNQAAVPTPLAGVSIYKDTGCGTNSLWIYQDTNSSGLRICFDGQGSVNMGDYITSCNLFCATWNDNASSWRAGCSGGTFFADANESGRFFQFTAGYSHNFDGSYDSVNQEYRLDNDTLSSLTISNGC